jgi:hypothetical protein
MPNTTETEDLQDTLTAEERAAMADEPDADEIEALRAVAESADADDLPSMTWAEAQIALMRQAAARDGIDYRRDQQTLKDLDAFVRALGNDEANEDKSMDWFMREAHHRVLRLRGRDDKHARSGPGNETDDEAVRAHRLRDLRDARAISSGGGDDDFGDIDALDGQDFEDAIARMTPAQIARFTRA